MSPRYRTGPACGALPPLVPPPIHPARSLSLSEGLPQQIMAPSNPPLAPPPAHTPPPHSNPPWEGVVGGGRGRRSARGAQQRRAAPHPHHSDTQPPAPPPGGATPTPHKPQRAQNVHRGWKGKAEHVPSRVGGRGGPGRAGQGARSPGHAQKRPGKGASRRRRIVTIVREKQEVEHRIEDHANGKTTTMETKTSTHRPHEAIAKNTAHRLRVVWGQSMPWLWRIVGRKKRVVEVVFFFCKLRDVLHRVKLEDGASALSRPCTCGPGVSLGMPHIFG